MALVAVVFLTFPLLLSIRTQQNQSQVLRFGANSLILSSMFLALSLWAFLISPVHSLKCTSHKFTNNKLYKNCTDLPELNSYLHFTYNASNSSLSIAFVSTPAESNGWVAWGINPTGTGMVGAQSLIAFKSNDSVTVKTYNLNSYSQIIQSKLSFDVWDLSAESKTDGSIVIFGKIKIPEKVEKLNQVWQVGSTVSNGMPLKHDFAAANLNSKGVLQVGSAYDIMLGASLSPNATSWLSPSGIFAFGFYPRGDGFAVGIWLVSQPVNTIVWTAFRDDAPVSSNSEIVFTTDGKLILRTAQGEEKPIADISTPAVSAFMLDSGNFVLYDKDSVVWASFDFPTDTILGGQSLSTGQNFVSSKSRSDHSSGRYFLSMQRDGNLVAYLVNSSTMAEDSDRNPATTKHVSVQLNLDIGGVLSINMATTRILANSSYPCESKKTIYRATLDANGIFWLYSHCFESNITSKILKSLTLNNQCDVRGFCGFNSYCTGMGTNGDCFCYPGFAFTNPIERSLGCYKIISEHECRSEKDPADLYNVTVIENMWWGYFPYSVVALKKEDCGKSCLEDCDCGAALYRNEFCEKHTFPLRYGKINPNISATAFFKEILISTPVSPMLVIESQKRLILILLLSLGSIACLCFVIVTFSCFIYRHRVRQYKKLSENVNLSLAGEFTLQSFSYDELEEATDHFKEELGRGSFGAVYKGKISEGNKLVAVKRLEKVVEEGEREFRAEMTVIGRTHHRNLVRLLGFCVDGSRKLLVCEYMRNGSLADLLFKSEKRPSWKERVRIALDVARGIVYLHEECEVHIIHCNIKLQNILMDDSWTAKISDFGLAKLLLPNQIKTTIGLRGTKGHLAPEWQNDALVSVKTDIFNFGVVLLEIICCRSSIEVDVSTTDEILLSSWVYDCFLAKKLDMLVEDEDVDLKTLERMVKVGLWCVQDDPALRPSIKNVILMLEGTVNIPVPPSPALSLVTS